MGTLEPQYLGQYFDYGMLLVFGGIPWQVSVKLENESHRDVTLLQETTISSVTILSLWLFFFSFKGLLSTSLVEQVGQPGANPVLRGGHRLRHYGIAFRFNWGGGQSDW